MITGETLLARLKDVNSRMPEGECADLLRIKQLDSEFVSLKQVRIKLLSFFCINILICSAIVELTSSSRIL